MENIKNNITNRNNNVILSIITVCLNASNTIEDTLRSVSNQKQQEIEYIVIDGDSTDETIQIINKYQNYIDILISEEDEGVYDAMNKGISYASGYFIYFLGADDTLSVDIINKILPILNSNLNVVHYGNVILNPDLTLYGGKFNKWKLFHKNIPHQSIFYPRRLFLTEQFNTHYLVCADWEFNLRIYKKFKFIYNGLTIATFSQGGRSAKGDIYFEAEKINLIYKYFGLIEMLYCKLFIIFPIKILNFYFTYLRKLKLKYY